MIILKFWLLILTIPLSISFLFSNRVSGLNEQAVNEETVMSSLAFEKPYWCKVCECKSFGSDGSTNCYVENYANSTSVCDGGNFGCQACSQSLIRMEPPCPDGGGYK